MSHLSAFGSLHSLLQRAIASASIWFIVKVMTWSQLHRFSFGLSLWNVSLCLLPQINYGFEVIQLSYIAQIKEIRHNASKCGHLSPKVHYREHINFDVGIPVMQPTAKYLADHSSTTSSAWPQLRHGAYQYQTCPQRTKDQSSYCCTAYAIILYSCGAAASRGGSIITA